MKASTTLRSVSGKRASSPGSILPFMMGMARITSHPGSKPGFAHKTTPRPTPYTIAYGRRGLSRPHISRQVRAMAEQRCFPPGVMPRQPLRAARPMADDRREAGYRRQFVSQVRWGDPTELDWKPTGRQSKRKQKKINHALAVTRRQRHG